MKRKFRQSPRFLKYKFRFNKKIKVNTLHKNFRYIHGLYCVKFTENCKLRYFQLRNLYMVLLPFIKKGFFKLWIFGNFKQPLTAKPSIRMGTGKGKVRYFVSHYKKAESFIEFTDIKDLKLKRKFLKSLRCKLPAHTIIKRNYV